MYIMRSQEKEVNCIILFKCQFSDFDQIMTLVEGEISCHTFFTFRNKSKEMKEFICYCIIVVFGK